MQYYKDFYIYISEILIQIFKFKIALVALNYTAIFLFDLIKRV